jgi:hypothetical protein
MLKIIYFIDVDKMWIKKSCLIKRFTSYAQKMVDNYEKMWISCIYMLIKYINSKKIFKNSENYTEESVFLTVDNI